MGLVAWVEGREAAAWVEGERRKKKKQRGGRGLEEPLKK